MSEASELRLRAILAGVPDPLVVLDARGIVLEASASVRTVFGWEPVEWIGREFPPQPGTREIEVACKDGTKLSCELTVAGAGGSLLIGSFRDVALPREAQMLKAIEAIGASASTLVHDIKNPATGIRLALQAVGDQLGEDSSEILSGLEQSLQKLERTMRRTLAFAKPLQPRRRPLAAARLLETLAQRAQPLRVEIECASDLPRIEADEALLAEALWNLVQNAIEALPPGGRVKLAARGAAEGALELTVEDDGPGLAPAVLPDLFRPFVSTKPQGTGLGLALCRKIVEAHGGEIHAARSVLGGAGFTIRLRPSS